MITHLTMGERALRVMRGCRWALSSVLAAALVACGAGGGDEPPPPITPQDLPTSRTEAARFLTQATFGPIDADIDRISNIGYSAWIDEQFSKPQVSHRVFWEAADAAVKASNPDNTVGTEGFYNSFWKQAVTGGDQLRQRTAFALSEIFVISLRDDSLGGNPRGVAQYLDMLGDKGFGNYRDLLESVALHPLMGIYLSSLGNQKADPRTGRVPDENFAREIMQLFSIGLLELNADGTPKTSGGTFVETYTAADIAGLAKVFTGWSWACPKWPDRSCFYSGSSGGESDADRIFKTMLGYPAYHSIDEKKFLGATIAAQTSANPQASLKTALDTLYNHPNVGPFIGKQLIQRLVTSNPSPAYVSAVAAAFNNNGSGVRGDMKAVIKAILLHPEARVISDTSGKLREPLLRLSAFLRAFGFTSDSGNYRVGSTDSPDTQLGQTPMRSPTVFNFFRPGYVPPGTQASAMNLAVPEMQIASETSASGYVNYMRDNVSQGVGQFNGTIDGTAFNRRDLQGNFSAELALAGKPADLLDRLNAKLMYGTMPAALKAEIQGAVETIAIPALNSAGTNQAQIDAAKRNRVNAAVFLTLISPEYQTQK
jgi:uncharacterized protein (DUF1800 family)